MIGPSENKKTGPKEDLEGKNSGTASEGDEAAGVPLVPLEPAIPREIVPLKANALTTLESVKVFMGIDLNEADPKRDAALSQLINAASAWLETTLGRKLGRNDYRERHTGTGTQRLVLEQYPIRVVSRVMDTDSGAEIDGYDWDDEDDIGVVYREDGWTYQGHIGGLARDYVAPRRYLMVEYTAGYILPKDATEEEPSDFPADLEALLWNMISQQWAIMDNDAAGLSAFSISDVSWTFDKEISGTWQSVISAYKRW